MMSSRAGERTLLVSLIAFNMALAFVPAASADPDAAPHTDPPVPAVDEPIQGPDAASVSSDGGSAADACKQFSAALNHAASNYEEFAYASAGGGNNVNYADPSVASTNVVGRTALREAAATAMDASMTPGLQPNILAPMRQWSLRTTKLLLIMGLHRGGDSLDSSVAALNADAQDVQMACATAGVPAS